MRCLLSFIILLLCPGVVTGWIQTSYLSSRPRSCCCGSGNTSKLHKYSTTKATLQSLRMMNVGDAVGLSYEPPVYRPPAEARSLILQVTIGCSWNRCTFCEMYQEKSFRAKPVAEIKADLQQVAETLKEVCDEERNSNTDVVVVVKPSDFVRDVFLADGDAMTVPHGQMIEILKLIRQYLPHVRRVSSYCLPRNIRYKSIEDLIELKEHGLTLVYVGCESGNDQVLGAISKGETRQSSIDALHKLQQAGIKRSVMILLGLGGTSLSNAHAIDSAKLCSETEPEFLSVLTTSFPRGTQRVEKGYREMSSLTDAQPFQVQTARESLYELQVFLEHLDISPSSRTIFRSDHVSNYLVLKGRLGRDKKRLIEQLKSVLGAPEEDDIYNLRPKWSRGL